MSWPLRKTSEELARRYAAEGFWTEETLGGVLHDGLAAMSGLAFRIWSETRPHRGTIGDALDLSRRLAAGLRARGIGPGDVVAFQLPNWAEAAACFWGTSFLGSPVVPIVHFYGPKEVGFILRESGARAFISADRFRHMDYLASLDAVRAEASALELVSVVGETPAGTVPFEDLAAADPISGPATIDPDAPALVAYTSGTTASPKGVIHTHRSILAEIRQLAAIMPAQSRPTLTGAPVGHGIGMLGGLLIPVQRRMAIHLIDVWNPTSVLAAMLEDDLTFSGGATYFLTSLLDAPEFGPEHVARIPFAGLGGSPVPVAVAERARSLGIKVRRSYGCTEHPSVTGSLPTDDDEACMYTDGAPLPGVEIRLVDEDGDEVLQGTPGEIVSRGPDLCAGYTDPALTEEAFDAEGWFASGDVGVMDANGRVTITDRKKDIISRGGEKVSAAEVEELLQCVPGVAECAVVAAPDARMGEHGCAYVRPMPRATPPTLDDVRRHLEGAGLARQKWPEELRIVEDFPRTPAGKIKKFVLREELRREADRPS